jgi:hypothetical protein
MDYKVEVIHVPTGKTLARTILNESEARQFIGFIGDSETSSVKIPCFDASKAGDHIDIVIRKTLLDECVFSFQDIGEDTTSR